ncbi:hypothetical protein SOCEGT47_060880 [Sorangium cellulosum]|uniref:PDZ domain-containing protein n=1 Tax=Sorangium cellulosum TaxID=56 RepID=A0A4P2Q8H1_SORCE|nr:PDZ domain-containing protein [Sorangium cellulosum]AUX25541.1 hypothetical protein SOCEGT47_060880 [Sorangium cellulosum]
MAGRPQQARSVVAHGGGRPGWARRRQGVLPPLISLAVVACRGDRPRVEATEQRAEAQASPADAGKPPEDAGKPPEDAGKPPEDAGKPGEPPRPAPTAVSIPAPWHLTIQPTGGPGARIASMDIRSFATPLLEPGDVILAVDGRPVDSSAALVSYLRACSPGDMVVLTVRRNETTLNYAMLQVPKSDAPPSPTGAAEQGRPPGGG